MTTFVVSQTKDQARAWMKKRGLQPHQVAVVVDATDAKQVGPSDRIAYVGAYWNNPHLREIQHRLGDVRNEQIENIADQDRGDLTKILGVTA